MIRNEAIISADCERSVEIRCENTRRLVHLTRRFGRERVSGSGLAMAVGMGIIKKENISNSI
jgi:hypothetical protein